MNPDWSRVILAAISSDISAAFVMLMLLIAFWLEQSDLRGQLINLVFHVSTSASSRTVDVKAFS